MADKKPAPKYTDEMLRLMEEGMLPGDVNERFQSLPPEERAIREQIIRAPIRPGGRGLTPPWEQPGPAQPGPGLPTKMNLKPSTGIPWVDTLLSLMRPDAMAGLGPMPMAGAGIVSPGARRGLQFVAEQAAERIPGPSRAKLAELLGRSGKIRHLTNPVEQLPSRVARAFSVASDLNMPQEAADAGLATKHYLKVLNKLLAERGSPAAQNIDQAGAYELLLLEMLGGRLP